MDTGSPLILTLLPLVAAAIALPLRSRRRVTVIIGLVSLGLLASLLVLASPGAGLFADNSVIAFGRELVLTPFVRSLFLFLYPAMGLFFACTLFFPAGRALVPVGLAILSPLAVALMINPVALGAVFILAAAALTLPVLHGGHFEAAGASWRYVLLVALGMAPLLLTLSAPAGASGSSSWLWPLAALLIWFGGFPFHIWVSGLGRHAPMTALCLALGIGQMIVVVYLLGAVDAVPAARMSVQFQSAVRWSAALTALIAAFQMARAADRRGIIAGLLLLDTGLLVLAALSPGSDGLMIALPSLMGRFLGLMLVTTALAIPPADADSTRAARWNDLLRPGLLIYGCLSLIGMPLTPGFSGRWSQLVVAGQGASPWPVVAIGVALTVGLVALFRVIPILLTQDREGRQIDGPSTQVSTIFLMFLAGLSLLIGLLPGLLPGLAARMLGLS